MIFCLACGTLPDVGPGGMQASCACRRFRSFLRIRSDGGPGTFDTFTFEAGTGPSFARIWWERFWTRSRKRPREDRLAVMNHVGRTRHVRKGREGAEFRRLLNLARVEDVMTS